jgi:heptaprenyl diphosphate synthase
MTGGADWSIRRVTRLGFLAAAGTALFVLESFFPLPLPFLKIGLANISTVLALITAGPVDAIAVVCIRVTAGSLLTGSFLGPSFLVALSAGLASGVAMALFRVVSPRSTGPVGLSLVGATVHVTSQLGVVDLFFVRNSALAGLLPLLLLTALTGGIVVGFISARTLPLFDPALPGSPEGSTGWRSLMRPADFAIFASLLAAIVTSFLVFTGEAGSTVLIHVDGAMIGRMRLSDNAVITVRGIRGDVCIEVRDRKVRVLTAECPNGVCVRTGWRGNAGDVIVCVPNKTVIRITGDSEEVKGTTG